MTILATLPPLQSPLCSRRDRRRSLSPLSGPAVSEGATHAEELEAGAGAAAAAERPEVAAPPTNRRLLRRPGWPLACASSTGGAETRPHPAPSPAAGRETAAPGATKRGRSRRTIAPYGQAIRSAVSGRHRRILQHLPSSVFTAGLWSCPKGAWRSDHPVLGRDEAAGAVLRPPFYLDFSISKSRISNSWCRFFKTF
jgi:hypothetical protein